MARDGALLSAPGHSRLARWALRRRAVAPKRLFWPARQGLRPWVLAGLYLALVLSPLALIAFTDPLESRPRVDDMASAMGLVAFAIMLVEFVFSGRHRWVSGRLGVDGTIRIHRIVAYAMVVLIAIHPFLYTGPAGIAWPWFTGADPRLELGYTSLGAGLGAWIVVALIVLTAIDREALPVRYETWRLLHAFGAVLAAALVAVHAFLASGYSSHPLLVTLWSVLLVAAAVSVLQVYVVRPWRQRRAPYVVEAVDRLGGDTWSLRLRAAAGGRRHPGLRFRPGQFAWITLGHRLFRGREHPFSISSAPEDAPSIGFTIKEKGDFTDRIGNLQAGTPAYIDGPHGHFVPDEDEVPTVYIAAGTGIGPVLSHLRAFHAEGDRRPLTLIYGAATPEQLVERETLDALAESLDLTVHLVVREAGRDWAGRTGRIDRYLLEACVPREKRRVQRYFVCGPPAMMRAVRRALRSLGVPARRIITGS